MRLLTFFSASHQAMAARQVFPARDQFDDFIPLASEQVCPTAVYMSPGWNEVNRNKILALSRLPADGGLDFFVDADVVVGHSLRPWLQDQASRQPGSFILFGRDAGDTWCPGVILYRRTPQVLQWFSAMHYFCQLLDTNDQDGIAILRGATRCHPFFIGLLDPAVICNLASLGYTRPWQGEGFIVPQTCRLWHANYTLGVDQKNQMLNLVTPCVH